MEPGGQARNPTMGDGRNFDKVASFFGTLDKVIRASKLYQGEGALLERMFGDLERRGLDLIANGAITVRVASFGLVYQGQPVAPDEKRIPYLFRMFCDGVRELTLLEGLDREQMEGLVGVLASDMRDTDEDMVTLLWKKQFRHVRYYAADTFTAGAQVEDVDGELTLAADQGPGQFQSEVDGKEVTLSADDIRLLGGEGQLEWIKEAKAPLQAAGKVAKVAEKIREVFRRPTDIERFVLLGLDQQLLEEGKQQPSALVLSMLDDLAYQGISEPILALFRAVLEAGGERRASADVLLAAIVDPQRLSRLAATINREQDAFTELIGPLVARLGSALVPLLKDLVPGPTQKELHAKLAEAGHDLTNFYAKQLQEPDTAVVLGAVEALGSVGTPDAIMALTTVLSLNDVGLRRAALKAMVGKYHPDARIALARVLKDPDRDNRLLALQVIGASKDNRMTWGLLSAVKETRFAEKDGEEQAAYYRALASFQDDRTVAHFQEILSRKNITRSKGVIGAQMLAVRALADVGSPKAVETLKRFRGAFYHPAAVKEAIARALSRTGGA